MNVGTLCECIPIYVIPGGIPQLYTSLLEQLDVILAFVLPVV